MTKAKWIDRLPDLFGRRRIFELECDLEEAQGQIEEMQGYAEVVAEDFEKDCWKSMRRLLDSCQFDWRDVGSNGVTALDAEEFILSSIRDMEQRLASAGAETRILYRHQKRGTFYELIGIGKMQAEGWRQLSTVHDPDNGNPTTYELPVDLQEVAVYRGVENPDEIWVRPRGEFEDGRFEALNESGNV